MRRKYESLIILKNIDVAKKVLSLRLWKFIYFVQIKQKPRLDFSFMVLLLEILSKKSLF